MQILRSQNGISSGVAFVQYSKGTSLIIMRELNPDNPSSDARVNPDCIVFCNKYADICKTIFEIPLKCQIELTTDFFYPELPP